MTALIAIAGQTIRLGFRAGGSATVGLIFFLAVVSVIPFGAIGLIEKPAHPGDLLDRETQ